VETLKEMGQIITKSLAELKVQKKTGFKEEEDLNKYLTETETVLEVAHKFMTELSDTAEAQNIQLAALKAQIGELVKQNKNSGTPDKQLTRRDLLNGIGKSVRVIRDNNNMDLIKELRLRPNDAKSMTDEWKNKGKIDWNNTGNKAQFGAPLTGPPDTGQYVINPIYLNELLKDARETSDMMGNVREMPMANRQMFLLNLLSNNFVGVWHTSAGNPQYTDAGKPEFGPRTELNAYTYAGYIPWIDEFEDDYDADVSLGQLFSESFSEAYGEEFDRQCLTASSSPFTGCLYETGALKQYVPFSFTSGDIPFDFFDQAALKIPRKERINCRWIVNETFIEICSRVRDRDGNPLYRNNGDARPARLGLYPILEAHVMPQVGDVKAGEPFGWFGNPNRRIIHGNRAGLEVRYFTETLPSLEHGEQFIRYRKRDAFKTIQQHNSLVLYHR